MVDDSGFVFDTNFLRDFKDAPGFTGSKASEEMELQGLSGLRDEVVDDVLSSEPRDDDVNSIVKTDFERDCSGKTSPSDVRRWKRMVDQGRGREAWEEAGTKCGFDKSWDKAVQGAEADAQLLRVASLTGADVVTSDQSVLFVCEESLGSDRCVNPFQ